MHGARAAVHGLRVVTQLIIMRNKDYEINCHKFMNRYSQYNDKIFGMIFLDIKSTKCDLI